MSFYLCSFNELRAFTEPCRILEVLLLTISGEKENESKKCISCEFVGNLLPKLVSKFQLTHPETAHNVPLFPDTLI